MGSPLRLISDSRKIVSRKGGVLADFVSTLARLFPDKYRARKVHELVDASFRKNSGIRKHDQRAEDRERVLITYFGYKTLLNRQTGGFYASYLGLSNDNHLFSSIRSAYFRQAIQLQTPCSDEVSTAVKKWVNDVYARVHQCTSRRNEAQHSPHA
jgi:hypothetical protein